MENKKEKERIYFNLEEFKRFFSSLDLNCRLNEGNIESIDGISLKGEITESKTDKEDCFEFIIDVDENNEVDGVIHTYLFQIFHQNSRLICLELSESKFQELKKAINFC